MATNFRSALRSHPTFAKKFRSLSPEQRGQVKQSFQQGGFSAARQTGRGMFGQAPSGQGSPGGWSPGDYNLTKPGGILRSQYDVNQDIFNKEAFGNRPNENNPWGSRQYVQDPQTGQWTINDQLSQPQQQMLESQQANSQAASGALQGKLGQIQNQQNPSWQGLQGNVPQWNQGQGGQAPTWGGFQAAPGVYGANDLLGARQEVIGSVMGEFNRQMQPEFDMQRQRLEQTLVNQGIPMGSEKWKNEMNRMEQSQGGQRQGAMNNAIQQGLGQQQGLFGMSLQGRQQNIGEQTQNLQNAMGAQGQQFGQASQGFQNALQGNAQAANQQQQNWANQVTQANMPYQQAQWLQGMQMGVTQPQFNPMAQIGMGPVDVSGTALPFVQQPWAMEQIRAQGQNNANVARINASNRGGGEEAALTPEQIAAISEGRW